MMKKLFGFGLFLVLGLFLFGLRNVSADCTDTDGGIDPFVFGTATANDGGIIRSESDVCVDSTKVNETYCSPGGNYVWRDGIKCGNGYTCSGGACIESVSGGSGGSPVYKKVTSRSPVEGSDGTFWTLFFMQLIVIALLFYVISKKMKK